MPSNNRSRTNLNTCISCGAAFPAQGAYPECVACIQAKSQTKQNTGSNSEDKRTSGKASKGKLNSTK